MNTQCGPGDCGGIVRCEAAVGAASCRAIRALLVAPDMRDGTRREERSRRVTRTAKVWVRDSGREWRWEGAWEAKFGRKFRHCDSWAFELTIASVGANVGPGDSMWESLPSATRRARLARRN